MQVPPTWCSARSRGPSTFPSPMRSSSVKTLRMMPGNVAGAGDVDGDGRADMLVGAYGNDEGGSAAGAAYLVFGPVTGTLDLSPAAAKLVGEGPDSDYASIVAGAGDVNGDGHDELLVGAPYEGRSSRGAAYLVLGPVTGTLDLAMAETKFVGEEAGDQAGWVSGAGDVNGDGNDDLLIGAHGNDEGRPDAGAAYLVVGPYASGARDLSSAHAKLVGEESDDLVWDVSDAGDVDSDGHHDLLISAQGNDEGGPEAGAAYLVLGPVTGTRDLSLADAKLVGEENGDEAGVSVSGAGDVDADGRADILVGALHNGEGGPAAGAAYLLYGGGL